MSHPFQNFLPLAEAICALLYPYGEVVIHDLRSGRIAALFNNLSKRKVGDESLLSEMPESSQLPDVFPPYHKTNWDGKRMKSVTATIRDHSCEPIGLFCINLDLSQWEVVGSAIQHFILAIEGEDRSEFLFRNDWREKINEYVRNYLRKEGLILESLTKEQKSILVRTLQKEGAFKIKNAAGHIADVLGLSRATIYKYLR